MLAIGFICCWDPGHPILSPFSVEKKAGLGPQHHLRFKMHIV